MRHFVCRIWKSTQVKRGLFFLSTAIISNVTYSQTDLIKVSGPWEGLGYHDDVVGSIFTPSVEAVVTFEINNVSADGNPQEEAGVLEFNDYDIRGGEGPSLDDDVGYTFWMNPVTNTGFNGGADQRGYGTKGTANNGVYRGIRANGGPNGDHGPNANRRWSVNFTESGNWYFSWRGGMQTSRIQSSVFTVNILDYSDISSVVSTLSVDMSSVTQDDFRTIPEGQRILDTNAVLMGGSVGVSELDVNVGQSTVWMRVIDPIVIPEAGNYVLEVRIAPSVADDNGWLGNIGLDKEEPDLVVPTTEVTDLTIPTNGFLSSASDEALVVYVVPSGTSGNADELKAAAVLNDTVVADTAQFTSVAGLSAGNYDVYGIDFYNNVSTVSTISISDFTDEVAPTIGVLASAIEPLNELSITTSEAATIYLVPPGTSADFSSIESASIASNRVISGSGRSLLVPLIDLGEYDLYAIDLFGNISSPTVISVTDLTPPELFDELPELVFKMDNVRVVLNEAGIVYAVPEGTDPSNVESAAIETATAERERPTFISTASSEFVLDGTYEIYGEDAFGNLTTAPLGSFSLELILNTEEFEPLGIYPNPTTGVLKFSNAFMENGKSIEILNTDGRLIKYYEVDGSFADIDLSYLKEGVYLIRLRTGDRTQVSRLIKTNH